VPHAPPSPRPPMARRAAPALSDQSIPAKLRRLVDAKRKGRSDQEIAEAADMTPVKLSQVLTGAIGDPRFSTVHRLLKALPATLAEYDRA
jgi:DNA-binding phage protein